MTTFHLRKRSSLRTSALGLVLSMGLIVGAHEVMRADASELKSTEPLVEEACDLTESQELSAKPLRAEGSAPYAVHLERQDWGERSL